jgi:hypothetical protein
MTIKSVPAWLEGAVTAAANIRTRLPRVRYQRGTDQVELSGYFTSAQLRDLATMMEANSHG